MSYLEIEQYIKTIAEDNSSNILGEECRKLADEALKVIGEIRGYYITVEILKGTLVTFKRLIIEKEKEVEKIDENLKEVRAELDKQYMDILNKQIEGA